MYDAKRTNFYSWQQNLRVDIGWLPNHLKNPEYSKVFTPLQFNIIEQLIDSIAESHNIPITNMLIKELLRCYYLNLIIKPQPNLQFNCSSHYVTKIKQLLSYSTKVFHPKRWPSASDEMIRKFKQRCQYIFSHAQPKQIVNSDESFFRCYQSFNKIWDKIGSRDVYINYNADEKEGFTFLATICLDGRKFPLELLSKGTTTRCEKNWFGPNHHINLNNNIEEIINPFYNLKNFSNSHTKTIKPDFVTDHSPKGWTNERTWKNFLKQLRYKYIPIDSKYDFFSKENRIYLITDCYGSHCCQPSEDFATLLNIDIIDIPKGMTSKFQPLDVGVNGIIKEEGKKFMNEEAIDEILDALDSQKGRIKGQIPIIDALSKEEAAAVLYCIWENISESDIIDAFEDSIVISALIRGAFICRKKQ